MLKQPLKLCSTFVNHIPGILLQEIHYTYSTIAKQKWDLFSAVCLERHPIITKPMNDLEKTFQDLLNQIEYERSLKNDFELRKELEAQQVELIKKGMVEVDLDKPVEQTAVDIEEAGVKELKEFQLASRITEADKKNITTSLKRKLDKNLLLLIEQKVGQKNFWLPPQGLRNEGETMRQTAERILQEVCGNELITTFYGNAPVGVYKYTYPRKLKEKQKTYGAKVFYFLAKYVKGNMPDKVKYQWLDRCEIEQLLPKEIHKSISYFLIPE